jgi:uroporphyrinogen III methyltransferase/synthase
VTGFVSIVGAGPWDPELLTLAGQRRLAGPHGEAHGDAIGTQDEIHRLLVDKARAGLNVVRLKGGDPMVFGRGGEEAEVLRRAGVDYEFVPGVSAAIAAPEFAGIPVTHRDHTPSVTLVSGYEAYEKGGRGVDWQHLAQGTGTLVLMMSVRNCRDNADRLIAAGRDPATPAALIRWGTRGIQRTIVAPLAQLADRAEAEALRPPAVMIVGSVVDLRGAIQWYERRPLFGRRVVVTRAQQQSGGLLHLLAAAGADAVSFPCLDIAQPTDLDALTRAARNLGDIDGVILSSPNGVHAWFDALASVGVDVRILHGKCVAVIGTGTANACWQRGVQADVIPNAARSEGLVAELGERNLLTRRWLHVRADEGRDLLGPAIRAGGGSYTLVVGYRVVRPRVPPMLVRSLLPADQGGEGCDAICLASGKTARHLLETLAEHHGAPAARDLLARTRLLALGPVTAAAVRALDLRVDAVADDLTDEAMLAAVLSVLGRP